MRQWLTEEINSAYEAADRAATFLDFDVAEFAQELRDVAGMRHQAESSSSSSNTPQVPEAPGTRSRRQRRKPKRRGEGDDDFFDDFRIGR